MYLQENDPLLFFGRCAGGARDMYTELSETYECTYKKTTKRRMYMKNARTIAKELGISKPTVYLHIRKNKKQLEAHMSTENTVMFFNEEGVNIIRKSLGLVMVPTKKAVIFPDERHHMIIDPIQRIAEQVSVSVDSRLSYDLSKLETLIRDVNNQNILLADLINKIDGRSNRTFLDKVKSMFWPASEASRTLAESTQE